MLCQREQGLQLLTGTPLLYGPEIKGVIFVEQLSRNLAGGSQKTIPVLPEPIRSMPEKPFPKTQKRKLHHPGIGIVAHQLQCRAFSDNDNPSDNGVQSQLRKCPERIRPAPGRGHQRGQTAGKIAPSAEIEQRVDFDAPFREPGMKELEDPGIPGGGRGPGMCRKILIPLGIQNDDALSPHHRLGNQKVKQPGLAGTCGTGNKHMAGNKPQRNVKGFRFSEALDKAGAPHLWISGKKLPFPGAFQILPELPGLTFPPRKSCTQIEKTRLHNFRESPERKFPKSLSRKPGDLFPKFQVLHYAVNKKSGNSDDRKKRRGRPGFRSVKRKDQNQKQSDSQRSPSGAGNGKYHGLVFSSVIFHTFFLHRQFRPECHGRLRFRHLDEPPAGIPGPGRRPLFSQGVESPVIIPCPAPRTSSAGFGNRYKRGIAAIPRIFRFFGRLFLSGRFSGNGFSLFR